MNKTAKSKTALGEKGLWMKEKKQQLMFVFNI